MLLTRPEFCSSKTPLFQERPSLLAGRCQHRVGNRFTPHIFLRFWSILEDPVDVTRNADGGKKVNRPELNLRIIDELAQGGAEEVVAEKDPLLQIPTLQGPRQQLLQFLRSSLFGKHRDAVQGYSREESPQNVFRQKVARLFVADAVTLLGADLDDRSSYSFGLRAFSIVTSTNHPVLVGAELQQAHSLNLPLGILMPGNDLHVNTRNGSSQAIDDPGGKLVGGAERELPHNVAKQRNKKVACFLIMASIPIEIP